jgi:predicted phage terminase large subunit-like protein
MALGRDDKIYIEHVDRFRFATGPRNKRIKQTARQDGKAMRIWIEQEPGSSGKESVQALIKFLKGFPAWPDRVTGSKEDRAEPFSASVQNGDVVLVKGDWNKAFLDELETFPNGIYSDQTDASSGAFAKLVQNHVGVIAPPQGMTTPSPWGI